MNIFKEIKENIYSPEYYKTVLSTASLKPSLVYLAKLSLLVSLVGGIAFALAIPNFSKTFHTEVSSIIAGYPDDLTVSIQKGSVSINKPEPYVLPITESMAQNTDTKNNVQYDNLVVIDTVNPFSIDQFREYSTVMLVTKNEIVAYKDASGQIQIIPLSKFGDAEITKSWLQEKSNSLDRLLPFIFGFLVLAAFGIGFCSSFLGTLLVVLFYGLLLFLIAKVKKWNLSYKKSYQISIHIVTVVVIFGVIGLFFKQIDYFVIKLTLFLVVLYLNLSKVFIEQVVPESISPADFVSEKEKPQE